MNSHQSEVTLQAQSNTDAAAHIKTDKCCSLKSITERSLLLHGICVHFFPHHFKAWEIGTMMLQSNSECRTLIDYKCITISGDCTSPADNNQCSMILRKILHHTAINTRHVQGNHLNTLPYFIL